MSLFLAEPHVAALSVSAGRFTLMVDRILPTVRYVSVEGPGDAQRWPSDAVRRGRATATMDHRCCGNDIHGPLLRLPGPA